MTEPEMADHIRGLQRWLAAAWRRLSDPELTAFDRRELRNHMKDADAALRQCLELVSKLHSLPKPPDRAGAYTFKKPDLRFLG